MGRLSTIQDDAVFAVIGQKLANRGNVTLQTVVDATGASIGSLYHRYGSREGLLARAWLDSVNAFQADFLAAIDSGRKDAGEQAALSIPRFCRDNPDRAIILSCCRQSEFLGDKTPADLRNQILSVNDEGLKALVRYAGETGFSLQACKIGMIAFPMGAVRQYLPHHKVPESVDAYVSAAFYAAIERADKENP